MLVLQEQVTLSLWPWKAATVQAPQLASSQRSCHCPRRLGHAADAEGQAAGPVPRPGDSPGLTPPHSLLTLPSGPKASPLPPPAPLLAAAGIRRASERHPHPEHQLSLLQRAVHGLHFWSNNPTLLPPPRAFSGPDSRQTQGAPGTWTPEHPYFWAVSSQNMPPGLPTDGCPSPPEGRAHCVPGLVGLLRAVLC